MPLKKPKRLKKNENASNWMMPTGEHAGSFGAGFLLKRTKRWYNKPMNIGYACLNIGVKNTQIRSCNLANASDERIWELTGQNLDAVGRMLEYNGQMGIRLFRMSSDIVPFAGNPVNTLDWLTLFSPQLNALGGKAKKMGVRLSMHPGQYTVLNSPRGDVVRAAVRDLEYHTSFMDAMGLGQENKIILHIGGGYENHREAMDRFVSHAEELSPEIRRRLVLENDERIFNIEEVLEVAERVRMPVVFDNLHHMANPGSMTSRPESRNEEAFYDAMGQWIREAAKTWGPLDGPQKIHYAQQDSGKKIGAHSATISLEPFLRFVDMVRAAGCNPDIMLEVKDKNLSAVKCINALAEDQKISRLEQEWGKYKYNVLEHHPTNYKQIRQILKEKTAYPVMDFYRLVEESLGEPITVGNVRNAAEHVWGYFKNMGDATEKAKFERLISSLESGNAALPNAARSIKSFLLKMQDKYEDEYLNQSLYFYLP
jgi:UV DNA damage endonuclease